MPRGFLGALLSAVAALVAARDAPSATFVFWLDAPSPGPAICAGGEPAGPLARAIDTLGDALSVPTPCRASRACAQAARGLTAAFGAACEGEPARGLVQAARAVARLEGARAISTLGQLHAVRSLVEDAQDLVAERRDEIGDRALRLCSSARSRVARTLLRPDRSVEEARAHVANGAWSRALRELASAASALDAASRRAASAESRCRPPACRNGDSFAFEPGLAGSPSLELVPPDRGSVAAYRVHGDDRASGGAVSGTLELAFAALARAQVRGALESPRGSVAWSGTFSTSACLDPHGWYRVAKISETLRSSRPAGASAGGRLAFTPFAVAAAPLGLVPIVPRALVLRVGDHVAEPEIAVAGRTSGGPVRSSCSGSHRVVAVEELRVPAGTFEAARVESSFECASGLDVDSVAWLVSEIGFGRVELRDPDSFARYELECFETPEARGRCAASAAASGPPAAGIVIEAAIPGDPRLVQIQATSTPSPSP